MQQDHQPTFILDLCGTYMWGMSLLVTPIVINGGPACALQGVRCGLHHSSKQFYSLSITSFDSRFEGISLLQLSVEANKKEWLFNLPVSFGSFHSCYLLRSTTLASSLHLFHWFRLYGSYCNRTLTCLSLTPPRCHFVQELM
jgi:hypothetical protein